MQKKTAKNRYTAASLSAFVFPGVGQFYKGARLKGSIFFMGTLCLIALMFFLLTNSLYSMIEQDVLDGVIEPDPTQFGAIVHYAMLKAKPFSRIAWQKLKIFVLLLIGTWIISVLDSFFYPEKEKIAPLGRKNETSPVG